MSALISIIVPVYNVETYIERCINSIINQSYKDLEIILINDGSTDSSGIICDGFAKDDDRIKVFHLKNGGSSIARNYGIERCSGDYIGFVDSDDFICKNMFATMIEYAIKNSLKVVECRSINTSDIKSKGSSFLNIIENKSEALERIIKSKSFAVWKRIYHRSVINNKRFIPHILHQDVYFTLDIICEIDKQGYIGTPHYFYNTNTMDSVIRGKYSVKKLKSIGAGQYVVEKTNIYNARIKKYARAYMIKFLSDHYNSLFQHDYLDKDYKHRKKIRDIISKYQKLRVFSFYGYLIKHLPFSYYSMFLKLNTKRINAQIRIMKIAKNV